MDSSVRWNDGVAAPGDRRKLRGMKNPALRRDFSTALARWSDPLAAQQRDDGQDHEHDEQDPGDVGGGACNSAEAEHGGDKGDDEKNNGVPEHGASPWSGPAGRGMDARRTLRQA